jgi:hypothetical protein
MRIKPKSSGLIANLEAFFASQCDGDWEHGQGIQIESLDNPGWSMKVSLIDTDIQDRIFDPITEHRSEHDWIVCRIREGLFEGYGGPHNLSELLLIFLTWARRPA